VYEGAGAVVEQPGIGEAGGEGGIEQDQGEIWMAVVAGVDGLLEKGCGEGLEIKGGGIAEVAQGPKGVGVPVALARGDLRWQMAVPATGRLPFDDAFPALIQWDGAIHPVQRLPDMGVRLIRLEIAHPDAAALRKALAGRLDDARVVIVPGAGKALQASFATPGGTRRL
jgi:hypothetical protein